MSGPGNSLHVPSPWGWIGAPKEEGWLGPGTESFRGGVSWGDEQRGCCHLSLSLCWAVEDGMWGKQCIPPRPLFLILTNSIHSVHLLSQDTEELASRGKSNG